MKQSDAVVKAIQAVLDTPLTEGAVSLSKEQRDKVASMLFEGFKKGEIDLSKNYDDKELRKYIPGLINNHLRKHSTLNGGVKYETKNPGVRSNPEVRELMKLMKTELTPQQRSAVQARIDELNTSKVKEVEIDTSKIDADLMKILGL